MSALLRSLVTNLPSLRGFYKWCCLLIIHNSTFYNNNNITIIISALDAATTTTTTTTTFTTETKTMIVVCLPIRCEVFVRGRMSYRILTYVYVLRGTADTVVVVRNVHCCNIQFYGHSFPRNGTSRSTSCYLPV
jgi:hypothetical protein